MNITTKTKGIIIIGNCIYKLNAKEQKELKTIIENGEEFYRGNQLVRTYDTGEFLEKIQEKYAPIGTIQSIHQY